MYKPGARKKRLGKKRRPKIEGPEARRQDTLTQTRLRPIVNENLFSEHFLEELLPERMEEWGEDKKIREVFEKIKQLYVKQKRLLESYNEPQLEEHFIKPIFGYLGHHFEVQETAPSTRRQPDYAFFPDDKTRRDAHLGKGGIDFYKKAVAVGDAKSWEKSLDKKTGRGAAFEDQNPSFQIDTYLRETAPRWAILTNGRCWRIYFQDTSYKLNSYFEVDLVDIINKDDLESFKYFYFFFRLEAFLPDERGKNFLDQVYDGSVDYARELGEGLQENVYAALKILAEGFWGLDENKLEKNPATIKEIHDNALVLLYRVLFALYAESRGLLDVSNETYNRTFSFNSIKREVAESIDGGEELHSWHIHYWNRLKNLFSLINEGSESRGIPKEDLFIPPYNGSLFNPSKQEFLERHAVGDIYLAKVIDLLSRSNGGFIDYSTLDIRHLGSIYEGLLEFKLKIAEGGIVSIREKGKEVWVPQDKAGGKEIHEEVEGGELYLVTDKGERKATGSYYTPGYVVKYIVENTLGPIVEQKIERARENGGKESEAILSIKMLDPAMGSGHFLVEAVDFLARPLLEAVSNDIEKGLIPEAEYSTEWAKREVVGHCIYGADLNPLAVELAKLSLWLTTIAKDKPLSFLDHRLKCGNSLIGTSLEDLPWHPKKKKQDRKQKRIDISGFVKKLVDTTKRLLEISDDTLDNIKRKEKIFSEFKETLAYDMIKTLADVRTSIYFGNEVDEKTYGTYTGDAWWSSEIEWKQRRNREFAQKAREISDERKFFYWELEFPEVFFEEGRPKEYPGFDAVVGNPPYLQKKSFDSREKKFILEHFPENTSNVNLATIFMSQAKRLTRKEGLHSFIVPKSLLFTKAWENDRRRLLPNMLRICDVSKAWQEVLLEQTIYVWQNNFKPTVQLFIDICENESTKPGNPIEKDICYRIGTIPTKFTPRMKDILEHSWKNGEDLSKHAELPCGLPYQRKLREKGVIPVIGGDEIWRYQQLGVKGYFNKEDIENDGEFIKKLEKPHIVLQRIVAHILEPEDHIEIAGTVDTLHSVPVNTITCLFTKKDSKLSPYFICAWFNSRFYSWYAYNFVFSRAIRSMDLYGYFATKVPLPKIIFETDNSTRKELLDIFAGLYVSELLKKSFSKTLSFVYKLAKTHTDVVHDILAYLARQMIEMNKQKREETKGFLSWVEREIGTSVDNLSNKTMIKEYHENTFDKLIEVLKKNKKKLPIDPHRREFQEKLKKEFDESMTKLTPLKAKIRTTDELIDQIVYRLYGFPMRK